MTYNIVTSLEEGGNTPIEELDLTVRTYNCLKRSNIHTVSQLLALSKAELLGIRNFGPQNYTEVRERLIARGFMDPDHPDGPFG